MRLCAHTSLGHLGGRGGASPPSIAQRNSLGKAAIQSKMSLFSCSQGQDTHLSPPLCWRVLTLDFDSLDFHCVAALAPSSGLRVHCGPEGHSCKADFLLSHLLIRFLICFFFRQCFASGLLLAFAFWLLRFCQDKRVRLSKVQASLQPGRGSTAVISCSLSLPLCPEEKKMKPDMIIR